MRGRWPALKMSSSRPSRHALDDGGFGEEHAAGVTVAALTVGPVEPHRKAQGLITVARHGGAFSDDDREVLRSLAAEAALALETWSSISRCVGRPSRMS